ncbi:MAG: hypothetical protein O3A00_26480 [Planctomycetota bacterium]|nr:hypothetical protein [Planctomycetota bacterium]
MADPQHLEIVRQGTQALEAWQDENSYGHLDLSGADLSGIDLSGAR